MNELGRGSKLETASAQVQLARHDDQPMRRWAKVLLYISVLAGSFLVTYVLTAPDKPADISSFKDIKTLRVELRDRRVATHTDLLIAARESGLRASKDLRGFIEGVRRAGGDVDVSGWLVDMGGDGTPPYLFVFSGGKLQSEIRPQGQRQDVTRALNLTDGLEENVKFAVKVKCHAGDVVRVLAVNEIGLYSALASERCP